MRIVITIRACCQGTHREMIFSASEPIAAFSYQAVSLLCYRTIGLGHFEEILLILRTQKGG